MKKILSILTTLVIALTLVGCNKKSHYVKTNLVNVKTFVDQISFDLNIEDADEEIKEDIEIVISIYKKGNSNRLDKIELLKKDYDEDKLNDSITYSFKKLTTNTTYTIIVKTTINDQSITLFEKDYSTSSEKGRNEIDINTVEDFFNIKKDPSAIYYLKADLDFEGREADIKNNLITKFEGEFYGNNKTIKNYQITTGTSYYGLFGTVDKGAIIKDLVIDTMTLNIQTAGSTRLAGLLFSRANSEDVIIDNITILNSNLLMRLDSESKNHDIGLLGGRSSAQISNIYIDENSKLTINAYKILEPKIGGLLGKINDSAVASVKNVEIYASVEVNVEQKSNSGLKGNSLDINIGGVIGYNKNSNLTFENVLAKTNINVKQLDFNVDEIKEVNNKDKETRYITLKVGGVFGQLENTKISNVIYEGNINIAKVNIDNKDNINVDEETNEETNNLTYKYVPIIDVGSIVGRFRALDNYLDNVLRINGDVTIANQEVVVEIKQGTLIGRSSNPSFTYNENNKFGYLGNLVVTDLVRSINSINDLFDNESWIYNKYNK